MQICQPRALITISVGEAGFRLICLSTIARKSEGGPKHNLKASNDPN